MHNNNTIMKPYHINRAQYALSVAVSIFGIILMVYTYGWKEEDMNIFTWFICQIVGYGTLFAIGVAMFGTLERITKYLK